MIGTAGFIIWLAVAVIFTVLIAWMYFTAQRLNRLHIRTDRARSSLQAALDRRAALMSVLVPAASHLARQAENIALNYESFDRRAALERQLNDLLYDFFAAAGDAPTNVMLVDATAKVQLATRFYNDAVTDTRALRTRVLVRALHLGGTARLPLYFELSELNLEENLAS